MGGAAEAAEPGCRAAGGDVSGLPGHNAAREIIRDFKRRRLKPIYSATQSRGV